MEDGFASVVADVAKRSLEVGLIGREGMSGTAVVLGDDRSPHATYIQAAGHGLRIRRTHLSAALRKSPTMQRFLLKFVEVFMVQNAHTAIANGRAKITERLARWLLMAQDRIGHNDLPLTHEFLALMLAVRRPGVTEALHMLESQGMIKASRAQVIVLSRKGLERLAGDLYGTPESEYRRLIGE